MCKACQPIRSHFSCKTSQELEFFALFEAVPSIELIFQGYAIEYTELGGWSADLFISDIILHNVQACGRQTSRRSPFTVRGTLSF